MFPFAPLSKFMEWLWAKLPDKCRMIGCRRNGVRGNENLWNGLPVCDDCDAWLRRLDS